MRPPRFVNVAGARLASRRVLPRVVFDYVDGGAEDEQTMHENLEAFRELSFVPQMAKGSPSPDLSMTVLGEELKLPVLLAPCGLVRLLHPDGPMGIARGSSEGDHLDSEHPRGRPSRACRFGRRWSTDVVPALLLGRCFRS